MAGTIFEALSGRLSMNVGPWVSGLGLARGAAARFVGTTNKLFRGLGARSKRLIGLTKEVSRALGGDALASAAMAAAATKTAASFEQSMARVRALSGATDVEFRKLEQTALDLGRSTVFSARQAAEAMQFFALAGFKTNEITAALPKTLQLAAAAQIEIAQAADIASKALKGLGLEASEMGRVGDVLTKAFTSANTDLIGLGAALQKVGPIGRGAGKEIEELTAVIQLFSDVGIQGCYSSDTQVLTRVGYKRWADVLPTDELATLNPKTNEIEYQLPTRLFKYPHKGRMYRVQNQSIDLLVTPNHNMWVRPRGHKKYQLQRADATAGKAVQYQVTGRWKGNDPKFYTLPSLTVAKGKRSRTYPERKISSETWAEFLGWYLSEGCCHRTKDGSCRVIISQCDPAGRVKVRSMLMRFGYQFSESRTQFTITNAQLWRELQYLGKSLTKRLPSYVLDWSPRLQRIFYKSFCLGDGDENGALYTSSKQLADELCELVLKCGWSPRLVTKHPAGHESIIRGETVVSTVAALKVNVCKTQLRPWFDPNEYRGAHGKRRTGERASGESWVDYDGFVYCAEVPNHLLFVRRKGKVVVCGNSDAGTALRNILLRLQAQPKDVKDALAELNITIDDGTGKMKNMADIIDELNMATASLTDIERSAIISKIAGIRAAAALTAAVGVGGQKIRDQEAALRSSSGVMESIYKIQTDTTTGAVIQLKSAIEGVSIAVGKVFTDGVKSGSIALAGLLNKNEELIAQNVGQFWEGVKATVMGTTEAFKGMREELDPLVETMQKVAEMAGALKDRFDELWGKLPARAQDIIRATAALTGLGLALQTIGGMLPIIGTGLVLVGRAFPPIAIILGLAAAFNFLVKKTNLLELMEPIVKRFRDFTGEAFEKVGGWTSWLSDKVSALFNAVKPSLMAIQSIFVDVFSFVARFVGGTFGGFIDGITSRSEKFASVTKAVVDTINEFWTQFADVIHKVFGSAGDDAESLGVMFGKFIAVQAFALFTVLSSVIIGVVKLGTWFIRLGKTLGILVAGPIAAVIAGVVTFGEVIAAVLTFDFDGAVAALQKGSAKIANIVRKSTEMIDDAWSDAEESVEETQGEMVENAEQAAEEEESILRKALGLRLKMKDEFKDKAAEQTEEVLTEEQQMERAAADERAAQMEAQAAKEAEIEATANEEALGRERKKNETLLEFREAAGEARKKQAAQQLHDDKIARLKAENAERKAEDEALVGRKQRLNETSADFFELVSKARDERDRETLGRRQGRTESTEHFREKAVERREETAVAPAIETAPSAIGDALTGAEQAGLDLTLVAAKLREAMGDQAGDFTMSLAESFDLIGQLSKLSAAELEMELPKFLGRLKKGITATISEKAAGQIGGPEAKKAAIKIRDQFLRLVKIAASSSGQVRQKAVAEIVKLQGQWAKVWSKVGDITDKEMTEAGEVIENELSSVIEKLQEMGAVGSQEFGKLGDAAEEAGDKITGPDAPQRSQGLFAAAQQASQNLATAFARTTSRIFAASGNFARAVSQQKDPIVRLGLQIANLSATVNAITFNLERFGASDRTKATLAGLIDRLRSLEALRDRLVAERQAALQREFERLRESLDERRRRRETERTIFGEDVAIFTGDTAELTGSDRIIQTSGGGGVQTSTGGTVNVSARFTEAVTPDRASEFVDAIEQEIERRGEDIFGRSVLRSSRSTLRPL